MASIFWDTMLFIYLIEDHPRFGGRVRDLLKLCEKHGHSITTSTFTLAELLVAPRKTGDDLLARTFREVLRPPAVRLIPFGDQAAELYADIRSRLNVTPADAIQLACAAEAGVNVFVTNDQKLIGKKVTGIDFIIGLDGNLLTSNT
jgi:predicted nucleic acid-binding protein